MDSFDKFDQYSYLEWQNKLKHLKISNFHSFLEESIKKFYTLYKKNKNSKITYSDYQTQLLTELEKQIKSKGQKQSKNSQRCSKDYLSTMALKGVIICK